MNEPCKNIYFLCVLLKIIRMYVWSCKKKIVFNHFLRQHNGCKRDFETIQIRALIPALTLLAVWFQASCLILESSVSSLCNRNNKLISQTEWCKKKKKGCLAEYLIHRQGSAECVADTFIPMNRPSIQHG